MKNAERFSGIERLEWLKAESRLAWHAGAKVPAIRALCAALADAPPVHRAPLSAVIRECLREPVTRPGEGNVLRTLLEMAAVRLRDDAEVPGLRAAAASIVERETPPISGQVNVLLAATRRIGEESYGAVHVLRVTVDGYGGPEWIGASTGQTELRSGFCRGVGAAEQWLCGRAEFADLGAARRIRARGVFGELPGCREEADGPSIALAAAVGTLSVFLDIPVPSTMGFTGWIDAQRSVRPVERVPVKLAAAVDAGLTTVYVPAGSQTTASIATKLHSSFDDIVHEVFPRDALESGIDALTRRVASSDTVGVNRAMPGRAVRRVLLSLVGRSDPIGTLRNRSGNKVRVAEGPLLGAVRHVLPERVDIFYTNAKGPDSDNDYAPVYEDCKRVLELEYPDCQVQPHSLAGVTDPTALPDLYNSMKDGVQAVVNAEPDAQFFVNVSSGTPDMRVAWQLLVDRFGLNADLLQVLDPRYAAGAARVRRVMWPE